MIPIFYTISFFLQAMFTPGAHRIDDRHIHVVHTSKHKIAKLDTLINESSGLAKVKDSSNCILTLNDSGGKPEIFAVTDQGTLIRTYPIPLAQNKDWEELIYSKDAISNDDHIIIGDVGNNSNKRKELHLYDYSIQKNATIQHDFYYEDQMAFAPSKDNMNYDCEAFFKKDSSYYFISKNRSKGPVKIYQLNQDTASHQAFIVQKTRFKGMVTACSFLPATNKNEQDKLAVLTYGRIYLFKVVPTGIALKLIPYGVIPFPGCGQAEGITWLNEKELLMSNEKGNLFKIKIKR